MKRLILIMIASLLLAGCGEEESSSQKIEVVHDTASTPVPTQELITPAPTQIITPAPASQSSDISAYLYILEKSLQDNFGENYNISVDDRIITVNTWSPGVAMDLYAVLEGNADYKASWEYAKSSIQHMSKTFYNELSDQSSGEYHIVVNVLNDLNLDNIILTYFDGELIYDVAEEMK